MSIISRITTWVSSQVLTASALNGEFNNVVNVINNVDSGTTSLTTPKVSANPTSTLGIAPKQYIDNYSQYRKPVLVYNSGTVVNIETGINGSSGVARVLFPDGSLRTDSTSGRIQCNLAQNAVFSGTAQGGLRTGAVANNTWYAVYAVETSDNASNFVAAADTVLPTQANFATLNSNFGTSTGGVPAWVYLGMIRYGDQSATANAILAFTQHGHLTTFYNSATGNSSNGNGVRLASSASASTLTWTYATGTSGAVVPTQVLIGVVSGGASSQASGAVKFSCATAGSANILAIWIQTVQGFSTATASLVNNLGLTASGGAVAMDIYLAGFFDGALGVGSNPVL